MVGKRIKLMREAHGWTQEELARRMGYKSKSTINKIEKDINDVNQTTINRFAEVFGCDPIDLMVGSHAVDQMLEQGIVPHSSAQHIILSKEEKVVIDLMRSDADFRNSIVKYTNAVTVAPKMPRGVFIQASPKVATIKAPDGKIITPLGMLKAPKAGKNTVAVKKVSKVRRSKKDMV